MRCVVVKPSTEAALHKDMLSELIASSLNSFIDSKYSVEAKDDLIEINTLDTVEVAEVISRFSGVAYAALAEKVSPDFNAVLKVVVDAGEKGIFEGERFSVKVEAQPNLGFKASDLQSLAISTLIGKVSGRGARPDEKTPNKVIYALISKESGYVFTHRYLGFGGLPSGTSGSCLLLVEPTLRSLVGGWLMQRAGFTPTYLVTNQPFCEKALFLSIEVLSLLRRCVSKRSLRLIYVNMAKHAHITELEPSFSWVDLASNLGVKAAAKEEVSAFSMPLDLGDRSLGRVFEGARREDVNLFSPSSFLTDEEIVVYAKKIGLQRTLPLDVGKVRLSVLDSSGKPLTDLGEAAEHLLSGALNLELKEGVLDVHKLTDALS